MSKKSVRQSGNFLRHTVSDKHTEITVKNTHNVCILVTQETPSVHELHGKSCMNSERNSWEQKKRNRFAHVIYIESRGMPHHDIFKYMHNGDYSATWGQTWLQSSHKTDHFELNSEYKSAIPQRFLFTGKAKTCLCIKSFRLQQVFLLVLKPVHFF